MLQDTGVCSWLLPMLQQVPKLCIGAHFSGLKTPELASEQLVRATKHFVPAVDVRHKLIHAWSCDRARECLEVALCYQFDPELWAPKTSASVILTEWVHLQ